MNLKISFRVIAIVLLISNETEAQISENFWRQPIGRFITTFDFRPNNDNKKQIQNENIFLTETRLPDQNQRTWHSHQSNTRYQPSSVEHFENYNNQRPKVTVNQLSTGFCAGIWSYERDYNGNSVGSVKIYNPNRSKNLLKLTLSLSADLQAVRAQLAGKTAMTSHIYL